MEQSLLGHTYGGARAAALDDSVGRLRPGLRADFAVLDRALLDITGAAGEQLPGVVATYVDGRCAYGCEGLP